MKKLSVSLTGHKTSISLEPEFIEILHKIAKNQKNTVTQIINDIDKSRPTGSNLSSEIRIYLLNILLKTAKL